MATATVRINPGDLARVDKMLASVTPTKNKAIRKKGLTRCAQLVQKVAATEKIVRGRGKTAKPLAGRLSLRTGELSGSIAVNLPREGLAYVQSDKVYAAIHEFGLGNYPERPFLSPALRSSRSKFAAIFTQVLKEELNR